jgi:ABC-2 type transport system ATP-binding protein
MLREGRLLAVENVEELRGAAPHRVTIRFAAPVPSALFDGIEGVSDVEIDGSLARLLVKAPMDAAVKAAARHEIVDLHSTEPDLEELFLGMYGDAENDDKDDGPDRAVTER